MDQINIRTHEDLSHISEKYYIFTFRQWLGVIFTALITIPLYKYLAPILGDEITSWLVIIIALPPMAVGFVIIQGLNIEKIMPYIKRQYISFGKPIIYKTEKEIIAEKEMKSQQRKFFKKTKISKKTETTNRKADKKMRKEAKEIERQEAKKTKKLEKQRIKKLQIERKQAKELAKAKKKYGDWESNTKALSENDFEYK